MVHRDLTPSNVVITWDDTVKIGRWTHARGANETTSPLFAVDFGLAKHRQSGSTLMQSCCGTMSYWWVGLLFVWGCTFR